MEEKDKILGMMLDGIELAEISKRTGISMTILYKWEKELQIRFKINRLIQEKKYEDAKKELNKLTGKENELIRNAFLIKIARETGDEQTRKQLLDQRLELDSNDVKAMSSRIVIARKEGDIATEKMLVERQLILEPYSVKAISSRISIAKREGDTETVKKMLDKLIELSPYNVIALGDRSKIAMNEEDFETARRLLDIRLTVEPENAKAIVSRIVVARKEGDVETEKNLLDLIIQLNPNDIIAMKYRIKIAECERDMTTKRKLAEMLLSLDNSNVKPTEDAQLEEMMLNRLNDVEELAEICSPIEKARKLIYEGENIIESAEQIKGLLEGENEITKELILAELYSKAGLATRAQKALKAYRKGLENKADIAIVGQAMELVKSTKTKQYNWNELWEKQRLMGKEKKDLHEEDMVEDLER